MTTLYHSYVIINDRCYYGLQMQLTNTNTHSPCIVADDANIEVAGQRIMWGKCLNAGQSCVAPDYILCTSATHDRLIEEFKAALRRFFGEVSVCLEIVGGRGTQLVNCYSLTVKHVKPVQPPLIFSQIIKYSC